MAKNMIRKSLALGAGLAIASVGLVAAPANAAVTKLELSPALGTGTQTVLGATFNMKLLHVGGSNDEKVEYFVTGAKAADITAKTDDGSGTTDLDTIPAITNDTATEIDVDEVSNDDETANINGTKVLLQQGQYSLLSISLDATEITETTTITITPFLDTVVSNDEIDDDEVSGNTLSVTFNKASEVTPTTQITKSNIGAAGKSSALVTLDSSINMVDTVGALEKVVFKVNGDTAQTQSTSTYNIDEGGYFAEDTTDRTLADGNVVSAQAFMVGDTTVGGPVALSSVTAGAIAAIDDPFSVTPSNSYLATDVSDGSGSTNDAVREGSGTIELVSQVTETVSPSISVEGQPVVFKIKETTDGSIGDASITAGGETLTDSTSSADDIEVTVLTDATGKAKLDLSYSDLDNTEKFKVTASAVGSAVVDGGNRTFTAVKSLMTTNNSSNPTTGGTLVSTVDGGANGTAASYSMVKGSNGSVTFFIRDQFGQVPEGTFRAKASVNDSGANMEAINQTIAFSGGQATLNWTDNNDAANDAVVIDMDLQIVNPDGDYEDVETAGAYKGVSGGSAEAYTSVQVDVLAAAASPSRVTVTNNAATDGKTFDGSGTDNALILKESYVTGDKRWEQESKAWNTSLSSDLEGVVYSATGGALPGASVTVSSPGVLFSNSAETVYSEDSITVTADRTGGYRVKYASNTIGEKTFTVTSGSASETTTTTFDGVLEEEAASITIDAPANAEPGSTIKAVATVSDQFGNPVQVGGNTPVAKFTYSGPGLVVGDEPVVADANGEMTISVLLGSNDTGTGTFTASYDEDGDGVLTEVLDDTSESDANNIVVSKSFTVGETVGDYGTQKAWTVNQDDGTAKVYVKFPEIDGKLRILHQTGGSGSYDSIYSKTTTSETMDGLRIVEGVGTYVVRTIDLADGTNRIRVSVDGEDIEVNGKDRPARYNE